MSLHTYVGKEHVEEDLVLLREVFEVARDPLLEDADHARILVVEALHQTRHQSLRVDEVGVRGNESLHVVGHRLGRLVHRQQFHQSIKVACVVTHTGR